MPTALPFFAAFGHKPARLLGREQEISDFMNALSTKPGDWHRTCLIAGYKGMGKSALVSELCEWAEAQGYAAMRLSSQEDWSAELGQLARDKSVLVAIDNVAHSTSALRAMTCTYLALGRQGREVALLLTGLPSNLTALLEDSILSPLKHSRRVNLGCLSMGAVRSGLSKGLLSQNLQLSSEDLDRAAHATMGHPFMFQLIGSYLLRENGDAEAALAYARDDFASLVIEPQMAGLSANDMRFMHAMASDRSASKVSDLRERLGVTDSYLQPYRARLIKSGLVHSPQRGQLAFTLPYLKDYLLNCG